MGLMPISVRSKIQDITYTRYHFSHELVNDGQISLQFCGSKEQLANMFTKPLGTNAFEYQREHLGIDSVDDIIPVKIKGVC